MEQRLVLWSPAAEPAAVNPFDPAGLLHLGGLGTMRNVTLALPTDEVRRLLPAGLELGAQPLTPPGTHPVILGFHDMFRLHTSFPSLLPSLTYHEHSIGIPWCYVTGGADIAGSPGPFYFMPALLLDSVLATLGGLLFWGYPKRLARIEEDGGRYRVMREDGAPLVTLTWRARGAARPALAWERFALQRSALSQPLLGLWPVGLGPWFAAADFPKVWERTELTELESAVEVHTDYVTGFGRARYPSRGNLPGIGDSIIGSYAMATQWRMSMPYPPLPG